MASLLRVGVFLALSTLCIVSFNVHVVAAHRKLNINEPPVKRALMSASSSTFYNAFDTKTTTTGHDKGNANGFTDIVDGEFNTKSLTNDHNNVANLPSTTTSSYETRSTFPHYSTNSYAYNADLPFSATNPHGPNGGQYSYPTTYKVSTLSSSNAGSLSHGKFPSSFGSSLPDSQTNYEEQSFASNDQRDLSGYPSFQRNIFGKQSFPSNDEQSLYSSSPSSSFAQINHGKQSFPSDNQQGLYSSPSSSFASKGKTFFYKSPSRRHTSPSKEQGSFGSASGYETSYDSLHGDNMGKSMGSEFEKLEGSNHVSSFDYRNEKPVTNYDSFFNSPTISQNEVEGSSSTSLFEHPRFPANDRGLTYGHVKVP